MCQQRDEKPSGMAAKQTVMNGYRTWQEYVRDENSFCGTKIHYIRHTYKREILIAIYRRTFYATLSQILSDSVSKKRDVTQSSDYRKCDIFLFY